ncbi:hypothetical protein BPOR_0011g00350 [Botrytis porri]|uniref:Uncharacterized protein n=1 Tax=Botrytis porri TaxID=87229 RepID=A0A4Z1L5H5_9HELO|nr:hypothetical protein BPOR_0011g00350 [Botrytis porri]
MVIQYVTRMSTGPSIYLLSCLVEDRLLEMTEMEKHILCPSTPHGRVFVKATFIVYTCRRSRT